MPHLLLIEDNEHIQRIYSAKLRAEGFKVTAAEDGEQGLIWADVCNPDVILLDIMLPKLDGFEVLKRLRADPGLSRIPVFMLSNKAWADDVQQALSLGARQFFTKGASTLQNIVGRIRTECGFKKLMIIAPDARSAEPILAAVQHPQLLCGVNAIPAETAAAIERGAPDLIVLDARQGGSHAFSVLQHVRAHPALQALRVIAITDDPQKLRCADGFIAGAQLDRDLRPVVLQLMGLSEPVVNTTPTEPTTVT